MPLPLNRLGLNSMGSNASAFRPTMLGPLAAWYDTRDTSSMILDGSNRCSLIADKSGNSAVNCLCLNGVAGNNASTPNAAPVQVTGDIDMRALIASDNYTLGTVQTFIGKYASGAAGTSAYIFRLSAGTGTLNFLWSSTGAGVTSLVSTVPVGFSNFAKMWVRVTFKVNNGSAGSDCTFYTSPDGVTWTQLGAVVTTAGVTSIFNGSSAVTIGSLVPATTDLFFGKIYRAQIYNGIAGTLAFDADFSRPAKLATSFAESSVNAATVTINTSGDYGARISGERDRVQLTVANQPVWTAGSGLLYDGSNDCMKPAPFSLPQPTMAYWAMQQVTWSSGKRLIDGHAAASCVVFQNTGTPKLALTAGTTLGDVSVPLATNGLLSWLANGASSQIRLNRGAPIAGNAGAGNMNGLAVGSDGAGANSANVRDMELALYSVAHDQSAQSRFALYAGRKWGFSV